MKYYEGSNVLFLESGVHSKSLLKLLQFMVDLACVKILKQQESQ